MRQALTPERLASYHAVVSNSPLVGVTAYSYAQALAAERAEADWILAGDSYGMVEQGHTTTRRVTLATMLDVAESVRRGSPKAFLVGDMPFGSYEPSNEIAVETAISFCRRANVDAVKLEGGARIAERVSAITSAGIPVIGHIGLTPQSVSAAAGYHVVGKIESELQQLVRDARSLIDAGVIAILLEALPNQISELLTDNLSATFLGIGAGRSCHGQLLIFHDIVGMYPDFRPRFARNFAKSVLADPKSRSRVMEAENTTLSLYEESLTLYARCVRERSFPDEDEEYPISEEQFREVATTLLKPS